MKTNFSILAAIIFGCNFLVCQELKIATFNCEFLNKKKVHIKFGKKFDLSQEPISEQQFWANPANVNDKFAEATLEVAKQIVAIDADVLGLTEVGNTDEVNILVEQLRSLGLDYRFVKVGKSTDTQTGQHVAILSKIRLRNEELSFSDRGLYFIESDNDEFKETGISKGMSARIRFEGNDIHLFLLHLKSERGNFESDQQRIKQAEIIRSKILPLLKNKEPVVVFGDFNSEKRHEVLLTLRGFRDIEEELVQTGDSKYFSNFNLRWTYEFQGNKEQIDHILLSIPLTKLCFSNTVSRFGIESTILKTENPIASDHNPFIVKLTFK
jgi:predicted extracellular nuclease